MPSQRQLFLQHVAQTSSMPLGLEVDRAEGIYLYDRAGKRYMDLNSGICVSSLGHCHPSVIQAVEQQVRRHMHTMVYGEHIQAPQVRLASLLAEHLPDALDSVYLVNSGTEAVEGALKLAKRATGRYEVVAARNAYHGSTQGAESLRSDRSLTSAYRPLIPGIRHIDYNAFDDLSSISEKTACVILEPVQAEAGVVLPAEGYLEAVRARCDATGALLILDEIQTGCGRTGTLWAFEQHACVPDILLLGKALGGGMPVAAFIAARSLMQHLTYKPALGHITTFGGHPVCCAAAHACLATLIDSGLIDQVPDKAERFREGLQHPLISEVRQAGMMMAVALTRKRYLKHVVKYLYDHGALVDWFLFNQQSFRLAPPLIISEEQIDEACELIRKACD
ncbi:MAG: aspartate aminotransferase family protein, partial [Saprospiraceae bacterium]|nr:aspartate aminotransferase family protein [Saprospiraceae bacterium]